MSGLLKNDWLTDADVLDICCGHFARMGGAFQTVDVVEWELRSIGDVPSGFLSHQFRLVVKCTVRNDNARKTHYETSFFVKTIPHGSAAHTKYISDFGAFKKEVRVYRSIVPRLIEATGFEFAPHCYLSKEHSLLAFEDLHAKGFRMANGEGGLLDLPHLRVTLETLATLHAASMIIEKEQNRYLDEIYPGYLKENAYPSDIASGRTVWIANTTAALSAMIAEIPRYSNHQIAELRRRFEQTISSIFELSKTSTRFRNAFGHGDMWKNNILFKYAKISEGNQRNKTLPVEAKFVDFQLARYAPPALDVMTICTMVTTSSFRQQHLDRLLDAYYTHLATVLRQHGLSVAVELPLLQFEASCEFYRLAGLIESCCFSHMILLPTEITQSIVGGTSFERFMNESRAAMCVAAFRQDAGYRDRMTDMIGAIVDDFVLPSM